MVMTDAVPVRQPLDPVLGEEVEGPQAGDKDGEKDGKAEGFQFHIQHASVREVAAGTASQFSRLLENCQDYFPKAGK